MEAKKIAEDVTMHGLGRILTAKSRLAMLLWLFFTLTFSGLLFYHLITIITKYFKNYSTIKEETIIAPEMQFPAITICGPSLSNMKHTAFTSNKSINNKPGTNIFVDSFTFLASLETKENLYNIIGDKDEFLLRKLGGCGFGYDSPCNYSTDFDEILVFLRSYCYRFNPKGAFIQKRSGSENGFSIILFLNVSDLLPNSFVDNGDAVEVIIQHHVEYPFTDSGTVLVPTGHLTQIKLEKTEIERMKEPYPSNCTNGEGFDLIFPGEYTTTNCLESCVAVKTAEACKGVEFYANAFLPKERKKPLLKTAEELNCLGELYMNLSKTNFSSCNCNLPCYETKYHKFASYAKWPATPDLPFYRNAFSKALGLNTSIMTDDFIRNNFMKLQIFFGDMKYKQQKEDIKYSFDQLISDAGGQMGIWLGASMFSIIELCCILGYLFHGVFSPKKEKIEDVTLQDIKTVK